MSEEKDARRFNYYLSKILPQVKPYDFSDKEVCIGNRIAYQLARTQSMFKYEGLPDTVPARSLELYLQINGFVCWAKHNGDLYAFFGGLGGEPDPYYMPTICTVANPALKLSERYRIGKDCVIMPNDSLYYGLLPMLKRYATLEVEAELSLYISTINSRLVSLIAAPDDPSMESAKKYLEDVIQGKLGVIADSPVFDGIKVQPYGEKADTSITNLIELIQYTKASYFNEIGLNANYNMKRESLNTSESQMNNDALMPLVDDMFRQRKEKLKEVNEMFGTNISVDFDSSWEQNVKEMQAELNMMKNAKEGFQTSGQDDGGNEDEGKKEAGDSSGGE